MTAYHAGRRAEWRCQRILELAGYKTTRSSSSKGSWDITAVRGREVRLIQVKRGEANCTPAEREALALLAREGQGGFSVELWRFKERAREPLITTF